MSRSFFLGTAIPYLNGVPHLGHALEWIYADVITRYQRQQGRQVRFSMGSDDHGQKVIRAAAASQRSPQQQTDVVLEVFQGLAQQLEVDYDTWTRTSSPAHHIAAQALWQRLAAAGALELRKYDGLYCIGCEAFKTEKDLTSDGLCPDHQVPPEPRSEQNYFFKLSSYQDQLLAYYEQHPQLVTPHEKYAEMKQFVAAGLEDVSFSRVKDETGWGVLVPDAPDQVMYVWCDALVNYLTAAGFPDNLESDGYWPADVIVVGKDINRFHSVLFTAMLLAADLPVPTQFAVHGHIMVNGQKMSKSLGNVIDPAQLIDRYGVEATRYLLLREVPFRSDGDVSLEQFDARYTADLCNGLGNLLSRTTNMIEKYAQGKINIKDQAVVGNADLRSLQDPYTEAISDYKFHLALEVIWQLIAQANQTIDDHKPWELAKTDTAAAVLILEGVGRDLLLIAHWLTPFMPQTAEIIIQALHAKPILKTQPLFPRLT